MSDKSIQRLEGFYKIYLCLQIKATWLSNL